MALTPAALRDLFGPRTTCSQIPNDRVILFFDPRDGEWSVQGSDGTLYSDEVALHHIDRSVRQHAEFASWLNSQGVIPC